MLVGFVFAALVAGFLASHVMGVRAVGLASELCDAEASVVLRWWYASILTFAGSVIGLAAALAGGVL